MFAVCTSTVHFKFLGARDFQQLFSNFDRQTRDKILTCYGLSVEFVYNFAFGLASFDNPSY